MSVGWLEPIVGKRMTLTFLLLSSNREISRQVRSALSASIDTRPIAEARQLHRFVAHVVLKPQQ